ncbi:hypothetical protein PRIPAC_92412 [Pristionchus pacificus]|uniref:Uncharacterized protein n=1 Tax=Pristionchus pacificus TaxID=54126 RepID=A0A2A6CI97_PRIPA|nr:hypothetical protein PRIPAC_92412 [Pristionchus pacificus]|eukprot:PDM77945.1 hypothetical protein PRIPAC_34812 [Pristionchus pacificus]
MKRSARPPGIPNMARPVLKASPSPKAASVSMWKEFEKCPEQQRSNFASRIATYVAELKGAHFNPIYRTSKVPICSAELAIQETTSARSQELDQILSQLQVMKFGMVYEQFTLNQTLANSAEEITELFAVDISARMRDVSCLGLPPPAEAHVAAGLREWQAKIDETPWSRSVRETLGEEAELLARRDELRASIDEKRRQIEAVNRIKRDERLADCKTREEAETLLNVTMGQMAVKDEDDLKSEIAKFRSLQLSSPPGSPAASSSSHHNADHDLLSDSDQEDQDDFLDTI